MPDITPAASPARFQTFLDQALRIAMSFLMTFAAFLVLLKIEANLPLSSVVIP